LIVLARVLHSTTVLSTLHLVRHGEVHNPDGVVYADLPGFGLSALGDQQAASLAHYLVGAGPIDAIITSPLERAVATADPLTRLTGLAPTTDERLTEWRLGKRWAGERWDDLVSVFPGELEAYLTEPENLLFVAEQIADVATRVVDLVAALDARLQVGTAVLVSHQDPVQAARLCLTGRPFSDLHVDKPEHASVVTLHRDSGPWIEDRYWVPPDPSIPFPPVNGSEGI